MVYETFLRPGLEFANLNPHFLQETCGCVKALFAESLCQDFFCLLRCQRQSKDFYGQNPFLLGEHVNLACFSPDPELRFIVLVTEHLPDASRSLKEEKIQHGCFNVESRDRSR